MPRRTTRPELTPEQRAEAQRIRQALLEAATEDLDELAELLAATDDTNAFGATEFAVRDIVLRVGAKALEATLAGRQKGATTGPAERAPTAKKPPNSRGGGPRRS